MMSLSRPPRSGRGPAMRCRSTSAVVTTATAATATATTSATVRELREVLDLLPDNAPIVIGVGDPHHVNVLVGDLAVCRFAVLPNGPGRALVIEVDLIS